MTMKRVIIQRSKKPLALLLVTSLLLACQSTEKRPSLADIDVSTGKSIKNKVFIKPKSNEEILKAYSNYLNSAGVDDKSRINALSRLAELEFELSNKLLHEKDTTTKQDNERIADKLYNKRLDKTINLLSTSLRDYPKSRNNDTLLYQLAKAYDQRGEHFKSIETLTLLIEKYPKSPFYVEAQFRIAEDAFSLQDYSTAEYAYTEVIIAQDNHVFYEKSLFKRGWARFKQQYYTEAVDDFLEAVLEHEFDEFENLNNSERDQFDEYFRAIGLAFSYLGGSEPLYSYFKDQDDFKYTYHTYSMVSDIYLKQERYSDAVETHQQFIKFYPLSENIPYSHLKIIEIWKNSGFSNKVYDAIESFYVNYNPTSQYWKNQNENSHVNRAIRRSLKEYVVLMTGYYHNKYQSSTKNSDYKSTKLWYERYLKHYKAYANQDNINFLYAELLSQRQQYQEAFNFYELAAFENDILIHKDAAYASIIVSDKLFSNQTSNKTYLNKHIDYTLKYSQKYPTDIRTPKLLLHAAEIAYKARQYKTMIELSDLLLSNKTVGSRIYFTSLKAESYFHLGEYKESESIYLNLLKANSLNQGKRNQLEDKLALAIYKQAELELHNNNIPRAIHHYARISTLAPDSSIASAGLYDAIALNMKHKQWSSAIIDIKRFQSLYPHNKHLPDVSKKLSVAYLSSNQGIKAAQEFEKISSMDQDNAVKAAALWQAAELYESKNRLNDAIRSYKEFTHKFKKPFSQYMEAMYKLVEIYSKTGNTNASTRWLNMIIKADESALNNAKSDRTNFITSNAYLSLARVEKDKFNNIRLSLPLKNSLRKKKSVMQKAVTLFGKASKYNIYETATESTYSIAHIYKEFSKALLNSDRPTNLNAEELDQYEILLEDQAFPFEDKSIEFYEINLSRIKEGLYNNWIQDSHKELITLFPVRYARTFRNDDYVNVIH